MESPSLPETGRIDLHSHLLPGIDDGCRSLDDSLECVRQLREQGYIGSVCTPHVFLTLFPDNTPENIARGVEMLRGELAAAGIDYHLWPGGELRIAPQTIEWLESVGVPTLGESRAVLFDFWGQDWPPYADFLCDWLLERGYQPILAHPERMGLPLPLLTPLLDDLQSRGVLLQGNLNSISGGEGPQARQIALELLKDGRYHLIASDMHRPNKLAGRFAGLQMLEEQIGSEQVREYLELRPRRLLGLEPGK